MPVETKKEPETDSGIQFFGEVDRTEKGVIKSEYPAYYFENNIDELREEIGRGERSLKAKGVRWDDIERTKEELDVLKRRLNLIEKSKPILKGKDKDRVNEQYKRVGNDIRDAMFTRTEIMKGLASPHEIAKRMIEPGIKVDKELAASCGIRLVNGKASMNQASKMFKILGKNLGEPTNVEYLRRDRNTGKQDVVFPDEGV